MRKSENNVETKQHAIKIRWIKVEIKEDLKKKIRQTSEN